MAAECVRSSLLCHGQASSPTLGLEGKGKSVNFGTCSISFAPARISSRSLVDCRWRVEALGYGGLKSGAPTLESFVPRATIADSPQSKKTENIYTVGDFMTRLDELYLVNPDTSVDEALEILVEKRITGLPVVDDNGRLVGVVSDYDLLALDSISGKRVEESGFFPAANSTWKAFKEIQVLLSKTNGKTVGELMSPSPLVVREMTNIEDAARLLLDTKFRRLPVVDDAGKLVGLLTRGNVVKAALIIKRGGLKAAP